MDALASRATQLKNKFIEQFGSPPLLLVRAPGRVNLIGEHTDYNNGFVFPVAIDREMLIAARPSRAAQVRTFSLDYDEMDSFALENIEKTGKRTWSNYLRAVLVILQNAGYQLQAFDAVLSGNVPQGAGLSSSAAFEVAVATLLNDLCRLKLAKKQIALLAQRAENEFIGVQCGIMDQFISALGEEDSALLIDCRSLEYRAVTLNLERNNLSIVITNSGVRRGLVDSEYNTRRSECAQAVKLLSERLGRVLVSLRDVETEELKAQITFLPDTVARRCRHVITENERVLQAEKCLTASDMVSFGQLMNQSHHSLRDDYQVSCAELDTLVELSQKHSGVLGARMTGAGFGGCTVAIMASDAIESFKTSVLTAYEAQTGKQGEVYVCRAVAGADRIGSA